MILAQVQLLKITWGIGPSEAGAGGVVLCQMEIN